jgi:hypothetical protein
MSPRVAAAGIAYSSFFGMAAIYPKTSSGAKYTLGTLKLE